MKFETTTDNFDTFNQSTSSRIYTKENCVLKIKGTLAEIEYCIKLLKDPRPHKECFYFNGRGCMNERLL